MKKASTPDDLFAKLREIEELIREKTEPDGSSNYDVELVMVSLEVVRRMLK